MTAGATSLCPSLRVYGTSASPASQSTLSIYTIDVWHARQHLTKEVQSSHPVYSAATSQHLLPLLMMHTCKLSAEWSLASCRALCNASTGKMGKAGGEGNCLNILVLLEKRYYICNMQTQCSKYNVARMQCSGTAQRHGAVQSCR